MSTVDQHTLIELVAFVDNEHETTGYSCHPQPGTDCEPWCEACKVLTAVPDGLLADARELLRERGVERD